ncbi:MAG: hypothetical protein WA705_29050 [Candidatus Ozemobacteraceae bacterium]
MLKVFRIEDKRERDAAGSGDLLRLLPVKRNRQRHAVGIPVPVAENNLTGPIPLNDPNSVFVAKDILQCLVDGVASYNIIHFSGPTGTAKSSSLEALFLVPKNFLAILETIPYPHLQQPVKMFPVEMAAFESTADTYSRRSIKEGTTLDEDSVLVKAMVEASRLGDRFYPVIWIREMGRCNHGSIQGGLLNLIYKGIVILNDGREIDTSRMAFIFDSNYSAEKDGSYNLVRLDTALNRRAQIQLKMDHPSLEHELAILEFICRDYGWSVPEALLEKVVKMGEMIRKSKGEGNLPSLVPPSIYGYLSMVQRVIHLPHLSWARCAQMTLLGNPQTDDLPQVAIILQQVFGIKAGTKETGDVTQENMF